MPYVGYFETYVCVAGQVVADRAILIVRDAGQSLPGLLGMNALAYIPRFGASISHLAVPDGTTNKEYVAQDLSLRVLYETYTEKCKETHSTPGKLHLYRTIFNTEFNIEFQSPRKIDAICVKP